MPRWQYVTLRVILFTGRRLLLYFLHVRVLAAYARGRRVALLLGFAAEKIRRRKFGGAVILTYISFNRKAKSTAAE